MNILFVGHSYHSVTGSSAFFVNLLKKLGNVECIFDDSLDDRSKRRNYPQIVRKGSYDLVVVWQIEYAAQQLRNNRNVIFVPMYDGARGLPNSFWSQLQNIRILCFSIPLYHTVQMAGCRALFVQYRPELEPRTRTFDFETAFYWYRRDDIDLGGIQHLTNVLGIKHLNVLYRPDFPGTARLTPAGFFERLTPEVHLLEWADSKEGQFERICSSGYYIASRSFEGIGMAFLEAMALGSVVVAPENSTYTDYIASGYNGLLYDHIGTIDLPSNYDPREIAAMASRSATVGRRIWEANEERLLAWIGDRDEPEFQFFTKSGIEPPMPGTAPQITVVTVVRNAASDFVKTFDSIMRQKGVRFEYLVVDGASTDGTVEAIEQRSSQIDHWVSERDAGIYDAMNKAARLATAEFVMFMNAGDEFMNDSALSSLVAAAEDDSDFLVGHHIYVDNRGRNVLHRVNTFVETFARLVSGRLAHEWHSGIPGHQATAVRTLLLRELRYDTSLDIAADHDLMFKAASRGSKFSVADAYICRYQAGGHSSMHVIRCVKQWIEIGLKHTKRPKAVWRFYAPQLLELIRARLAAASGAGQKVKVVTEEWGWIARAALHLPPRQVLRQVKRVARGALRRFRKTGRAFDLRLDRDIWFTSKVGLSWAERGGVWTDWPTVHIAFNERIAGVRHLKVVVSQVSPLLANDTVTLVINGRKRIHASLGPGISMIDLGEIMDVDELTLLVPVAASQARLGKGQDDRLLGYMIKRLALH